MPSAKLARRRERADIICEAVRALDATGKPLTRFDLQF